MSKEYTSLEERMYHYSAEAEAIFGPVGSHLLDNPMISVFVTELNEILSEYDTELDIPDSLMRYAFRESNTDILRQFLEDGVVFFDKDERFGWIR